MKPGLLLLVLMAIASAFTSFAASLSISLDLRATAAVSRRSLAAVGSPEDQYLQIANGSPLPAPREAPPPAAGLAAIVDGGTPALLLMPLPAPETEVLLLLPEPEAVAAQQDQSDGDARQGLGLGDKVGDAATGVGQGIAEAAKSVADGAVVVADTAGGAVADALDAVAALFHGHRRLLQIQATVAPPEAEPQLLLLVGAPDLDSPVPFYAALLQPALDPFLPASQQRQALLQELATELAPVVDAALNVTQQQLEELLAEVEELIPAGASEAEVAAVLADPAFWAVIEGPLNATTEALASTLAAAAEGAGEQMYSLLSGAYPSQLGPFPSFMDEFLPSFVTGLTQGVLDVVYRGSPEAAAAISSFGLRRSLLQAAGQQEGTGWQAGYHTGTVVGCSTGPEGDECTGYRVQGTSPEDAIATPIPATKAEQIASGLAGQAAAVGGAALQAGVLAGAGALQAASTSLQAASTILQAELVHDCGMRRALRQTAASVQAPEVEVVSEEGPAGSAAQGVQNAIAKGTRAASQGVAATGSTAASMVGGVAGVAADAANKLALAAVQSRAQLMTAVQNLVDTGHTVEQLVSG